MELLLIVLIAGGVAGVLGYLLGHGKLSTKADLDAVALLQEAQQFFILRMDMAEKDIRSLTERIKVLEARIAELESEKEE